MKTCSKCKQPKSESEFHKDNRPGRDTRPYCKTCDGIRVAIYRKTNRERVRAVDRSRYRDKPYRRNTSLLKKYGITLTDYQALSRSQNDLCAICVKPDPTGIALAVDHDHKTGKVRGLLCVRCNLILGNALDDAAVLDSASEYLRNHNAEQARAFVEAYMRVATA